MTIAIILISIFGITDLAWLVRRFTPFKICPICAGVAGTWAWILAGMSLDLLPTSYFLLPVAIMMGGSVVGIAYQLEKRLPPGRSPLLWKSLFIPTGFAVPYALLMRLWPLLAISAAALAAAGIAFFARRPHAPESAREKTVETLEDKMKQCC